MAGESVRANDVFREVPWQIWIVVAVLGLEGLGNLLSIPGNLTAAVWLGWKCLFIVGLIRGWRPVFVLFLVIASWHVVVFAMMGALFVAFINLVLVLLAGATWRRFFPGSTPGDVSAQG